MRGSTIFTTVAAGILLAACGSASAGPPAPQPTVKVADLSSLHSPLNLGLIVTAQQGAEGQQDDAMAAGAQVAQFRLADGGGRVHLIVVNDLGFSQGSTEAVSTLLRDHVAGIVYASSGPHILAGVEQAAKAKVPVLLPYQQTTRGLPSGSWTTGPQAKTAWHIVPAYVKSANLGQVLAITGPGSVASLPSLPNSTPANLAGTPEGQTLTEAVANDVSAASSNGRSINAAVVNADATSSAWIAAGLEQAGVSTIVFGPDATSPQFAQVLTGVADGTAQGTLISEGITATDISNSPAVVSYLSALRLLADQSLSAPPTTAVDLSQSCFAQAGAATADTRSHDAVMALAAAAAKAGSTSPSAVRSALQGGLEVTAADGLAGPALKFGVERTALPASAVVLLQSSATPSSARENATQQCSTGGAPSTSTFSVPSLQWFEMPTGR